jgi:DMSO/TMAO reductase YedYZ molybdopterin-dependent catalytic subunit
MSSTPRDRITERAYRRMSRRELLTLAPLAPLAALALPDVRDSAIRAGLALSDRAGEWMFRPTHLAPTYADADVTPFERFPINRYVEFEPTRADLATWRLTVEGQVSRPGEYTLEQIMSLPKVVQNVRHICIEGWDVIGSFGGVRLRDFLIAIGVDAHARFVEFRCADDYYESLDMAAAQHPQSLLCDEMYGRPLTREHGAPLRLALPTKLGYKQAKYITSLRVTNVLGPKRGYWVDRGYSWHGGL